MADQASRRGRRKVLFLAKQLGQGGVQRMVATSLSHLDRDRFEPHLCLWGGGKSAYALPPDLPACNLHQAGRGRTPAVVAGMVGVLRRTRPDLVFSHKPSMGPAVRVALRLAGWTGPWVVCVHGHLGRELAIPRRVWRWVFARVCRVVTVSSFLVDEVIDLTALPRDRFRTVRNPVDFGVLPPPAERSPWGAGRPFRIVSAGRFSEEKDYPTLVRAFAEVRRKAPTELVLLGDGPQREELAALSASLGVEADVQMPGWQADPFPTLASGDVFVLPSRLEGFGLALVEAMGLALPCVATRSGGPEEIITHGQDGLLVAPGSPEELAEALLALHADPAAAKDMGQAAARSARSQFAAAGQTRKLEHLFDECLADRTCLARR